MKIRIVGMVMVIGVIWMGTGFAMEEGHLPPPKPGSAEFQKIKALAGMWKGTVETEGKTQPAEINYKVTSNGSVVVETLFPNTPEEMVSVYHDDENGKLSMIHYCAIGNQPQLDLKRSEENKIELDLSPKSNLANQQHMHGLDLSFKSPTELTQSWTCFEGGQAHHKTTVDVKKV